MRVHVYFEHEGLRGRETFTVQPVGGLWCHSDALEQFWTLVKELGARTVDTMSMNAWQQVEIVSCPHVYLVEREV
jgi:hypothetical protein